MTGTPETVLLLGGTGTIGRATAVALRAEGYKLIAPVRPGATPDRLPEAIPCDLSEPRITELIAKHCCTAVVSCIASRTGVPEDAWAVDHGINAAALRAALATGVERFVLVSAICVQRPKMAFQHAKLAFEEELQTSDLTWSIVRPTAYFKSLSGQVERLRRGKPFLLFGDGAVTACKPIGDRDLARFLVACLADPALQNRILPIGGPGPAITPREQGEILFETLGLPPRFKHVPLALMSSIVGTLTMAGRLHPKLREKAELARIGQYYATESMLVWNAQTGAYDADATPETGSDTLLDHYRRLARGEVEVDRGSHAVF